MNRYVFTYFKWVLLNKMSLNVMRFFYFNKLPKKVITGYFFFLRSYYYFLNKQFSERGLYNIIIDNFFLKLVPIEKDAGHSRKNGGIALFLPRSQSWQSSPWWNEISLLLIQLYTSNSQVWSVPPVWPFFFHLF